DEFPLYPGTGRIDEIGAGDGLGATINLPLPAGATGDVYRAGVDEVLRPLAEAWAPTWLLLSAGFDAHERDPLGGLRLIERDFSEATKRLLDVADKRCGGRVVSLLEGGYDVSALAASVSAHIRVLMRG
ncbi:MAG: histone deacetylase family protein, partial [Methylocystis sp.]|nr:histone deacetylase family protein [Methylocystis sp.]